MRTHAWKLWSLLLPLVLVTGCNEKDETAPPAPWVDEIQSPTPEQQPLITGSAEYGSTVRITGGAQEVETTADQFTARWKVRVPLNLGASSLSVTATDGAGNESEPTVVDVEYIEPGTPTDISITGPTTARAGEPVTFQVEATDVFGNPVDNLDFTLTTDAPAGTTTMDASNTLTFCAVGTWLATVETLGGGLSAEHEITVSPGRPVALSLETTPSPAVVTAGDTVDYTTTVLDSCGNVTDDWVDVYTNAPGAIAVDGTLSGLTRAGAWTIVAQVPGTSAADSASLLVDADESSTAVVLSMTAHSGFVGVPIGYAVTAVDGYGNPVQTPPVITVPTDLGAVIDPITSTIVFSIAGTHTITATVGTASDSDYVVVTDPDLDPPDVTITDPPTGTIYAPGDTVTVTVSATDGHGLSRINLTASGAGDQFHSRLVPVDPVTLAAPTAYVATFLVHLPGGGYVADISLVAQAVDTTGNLSNSAEVVIHVDPAADLVLPGGFTAETVSYRDWLDNPRGMALDGLGWIYVANEGPASVVQINPLNGVQAAFTPEIVGGVRPEDVVYYPSDNVFFLTARRNGTDRIYRIDSAGVAFSFTQQIGPGPRGIIIDGGTSILAMWDDGIARRYDPAAAPFSGPIFVMDANWLLNGNAWGIAQVGNAYAATDRGNDEVWMFDPPASSWNNVQNPNLIADMPPIDRPRDIVLSPGGGRFYVANEGDGRIIQIDVSTCTGSPCPSTTIVSGMNGPYGLVFEASGSLLVSDRADDIIYRISGPL